MASYYLKGTDNNDVLDELKTNQYNMRSKLDHLIREQTKSKSINPQSELVYTTQLEKNIVDHDKETRLTQLSLLLMDMLIHQDGVCHESVRLGGNSPEWPDIPEEGSWIVCKDKDKWLTHKKNQSSSTAGTLISFGIANDFSFDDEMAKMGLRVESFDPSMKMKSTKRSEHHHYWNIGVSSEDNENFKGKEYRGDKEQIWKVYTLNTMMEKYNIDFIDYLKMDVEGAEWPILQQWVEHNNGEILKKIKLLSFEAHFHLLENTEASYMDHIKVILGLREAGFKLFALRQNPHCSMKSVGFFTLAGSCTDLYWYNDKI